MAKPIESKQLKRQDLWSWMDMYHWKHWHGLWVRWEPSQSATVNKTFHTVRSFQAHNEQHTSVLHRNDWYNPTGGAEASERMFGPWVLTQDEHCLDNGLVHPANPHARTLIFPNGDLAWLPLQVGNSPSSSFFVAGETHFVLPEKNARMAIILGHSVDGKLIASEILEDALDTGERPDAGWHGNIWNHELAIKPLEQTRDEPVGTFVGQEMVLTSDLVLTTHSEKAWKGFKGEHEEGEKCILVHLPFGFTACLPERVISGQAFSYAVHWVVNRDQVRTISYKYSSEGKFVHVKSAEYLQQCE